MYTEPDELSWDPTMLAVNTGDDFQYDIQPLQHAAEQDRVYPSPEALLSSISGTSIRGPGTRVWRACMVEEAGKPYGQRFVFKDSWPDSERPCRGDVLAAIREAIDQAVFAESFLPVVEHGDVHMKMEHTLDEAQREVIKARADAPDGDQFHVEQLDCSPMAAMRQGLTHESRQGELCSGSSDSGTNQKHHEHQDTYATYRSKSHYRIFFKELCRSLNDEENLGVVFGALSDTCCSTSSACLGYLF